MTISPEHGIVYLVGSGPGDPGLITVRGIECLEQADVVIYDRLASQSLLAHARQATLINVGKQPDRHRVPQEEINALLVEHARQGKVVVRLKGGDPFVFGRGGEEALELAKAGLPFKIIPGVTSAIAAPAYAGIPVTHRGIACHVTIITGHRANSDALCDWEHLAHSSDTLVFLMGVRNLPHIAEQLLAHGRAPDTPVAVVERASHRSQDTLVGELGTIAQQAVGKIRPPAVIIVGQVVNLRQRLRWFDRSDSLPLLGLRVLNTRPLEQVRDLSRRLMALGAEPVELPTTQVMPVSDFAPLDRAIDRLVQPPESGPYWPWIVFSSVNSVTFFLERLLTLGHDVRHLAGVKLVALGQATVDMLRKYGLAADVVPTEALSREVAAGLERVNGHRVLLPRSDVASASLPQALRAQGALVEEVTVYTVQPVEPDPFVIADLLEGGVDTAIFLSPSVLSGLAAMLDGHSLAKVLSPLTVACIGPVTANAARARNIRVDVVAQEHTVPGLLEALVDFTGVCPRF